MVQLVNGAGETVVHAANDTALTVRWSGFSEPCSAQCILTIAHYIGLGQGPGHAGLVFSVRLRGEGKLGLNF